MRFIPPRKFEWPTHDGQFSQVLNAKMGRRAVLGLGAITLAGCVTHENPATHLRPAAEYSASPATPSIYRAVIDSGIQIPAVDIRQVDQRYWRTDIDYASNERAGTLIVDTPNKYLYHVLPGSRATRYGVGVGREGFEWSGRAIVAYSRQWPRWVPPDSMIKRQPELAPYSAKNGGMEPGLRNPLGARALYIHEGGRDTLYRLHGTNEPDSIGKAVSSGCIRLLNQDVIHLYNTVKNGSPIVVIPDPAMASLSLSGASKS
ncbi:lipoprotein-anchoring transpeptidase ErfK/SrfK [Nitrobacteraceae bacterium AZCC 1564]